MREIEIKLRVDDMKALEEKLREAGLVLGEPLHQHDIVYSKNGAQEFASAKEGDVVVRIRRENNIAEFNLKKQQSVSEMDNLEYETEIKDPEEMDSALRAMGWNPEVEVKKVRRKGKLGEYEICLDEVEGLGSYVELEKLTAEDADSTAVREELFAVLEKFGLSRDMEETQGYDTQLYLKNPK